MKSARPDWQEQASAGAIERRIDNQISVFEKLDIDLLRPCGTSAAYQKRYAIAEGKMLELGTLIEGHGMRTKYRSFYEGRFFPKKSHWCE